MFHGSISNTNLIMVSLVFRLQPSAHVYMLQVKTLLATSENSLFVQTAMLGLESVK